MRCIRDSSSALIFGPVARLTVRNESAGSNVSVQLLPPMWSWLLCLLVAAYLLLNVFESQMVIVLRNVLVGTVGGWLATMTGFWLDANRTEQLIRQFAQSGHRR